MKKALHVRIYGEVHGVGFRKYVLIEAEKRGISGWVRNRTDETVEVQAYGADSILEDFLTKLRAGSPSSVVADIEDAWQDYDGDLSGEFEIKNTK